MKKFVKAEIYEPVYTTTIYLFAPMVKQTIAIVDKLVLQEDKYQYNDIPTFKDVFENGSAQGQFRKLNSNLGIIAFREAIPTIDCVAHECVHAATKLLCPRGIEIDAHNDEPAAYYVGYLVSQICTHLKVNTKYKKHNISCGFLA